MAKISNHNIRIYHEDINKDFKVNLMYSSDYLFHIEIPEEFFEVVHHLDEKVLDEKGIIKKYKTRAQEGDYRQFICAETESLVLSRAKECIQFLIDKSIVQRNVIIVFYNPKDICNYNNHIYNHEHPQIGMQFGLTYAIETCVGDKKVYSIYPEGGYHSGCTLHKRKELSLWNRASIIIPDTPESRETLEGLYNAFISLNKKMSEFTETPEKMLEFISSKVKLLT